MGIRGHKILVIRRGLNCNLVSYFVSSRFELCEYYIHRPILSFSFESITAWSDSGIRRVRTTASHQQLARPLPDHQEQFESYRKRLGPSLARHIAAFKQQLPPSDVSTLRVDKLRRGQQSLTIWSDSATPSAPPAARARASPDRRTKFFRHFQRRKTRNRIVIFALPSSASTTST